MNAIPKAGGNRFSGSALVNGSGPSLQGSNITDDLRARGVTGAASKLKTLYDINGAVGGPIKRDKVWFYATSRYFTNEYYLASKYYAVDPTTVVRANDTVAAGLRRHLHLRQQRPRHLGDQRQAEALQLVRLSVQGGPALADPDLQRVARGGAHHDLEHAALDHEVDLHGDEQAAVRGRRDGRREPRHDQARSRAGRDLPEQGSLAPRCISITEQTAGNFFYRAPTGFDFDDRLPSQTFNGSMSYVTGSHNAKVGLRAAARPLLAR